MRARCGAGRWMPAFCMSSCSLRPTSTVSGVQADSCCGVRRATASLRLLLLPAECPQLLLLPPPLAAELACSYASLAAASLV